MSKKSEPNKDQRKQQRRPVSSMPGTIQLKNMTNSQSATLLTMLHRIESLEGKVTELEGRVRIKQRRIRRPSWQVQKRYKCQTCKRKYGSLVALNLHLRIKHKKGKEVQDMQRRQSSQSSQSNGEEGDIVKQE